MNRRSTLVTALLLVGLLTGCSRTESEVLEAKPFLPGLEGHFYVVAGEQDSTADLHMLRFNPVTLSPLTKTNRVTTVASCDTTLVVAAAQQEVGFSDTLQLFRAGKLRDIDGLGKPKGSVPDLAPDCRIAYIELDRSTEALSTRLLVWDPVRKTNQEVHSAPRLGGPHWGPGGRLATIELQAQEGAPPSATEITILAPDGSRRTIDAPAPDLGGFQWGAAGWMAILRLSSGTVFLNPDTGEQSELPGWAPLAWSPDGMRLLVTDIAASRALGLVDLADRTSVRKLGEAKLGVYDAVWLPITALPTRPQ